MASITITRNTTLPDTGVKQDLHNLIDTATATIASITGADISTIEASGKVGAISLFNLSSLPSAGQFPYNALIQSIASGQEVRFDGTKLTGANNDAINIVSAPSADVTATGIKVTLTAGSTMAFGDIGYIAATGKVILGDADAIATSSCVVMALGSITADTDGPYLLSGIARNDAWNWTVGGLIYLSTTGTTGNTLTQTAPSGTDDVIQIVGVATHADRMYFNPSLVQIEHV